MRKSLWIEALRTIEDTMNYYYFKYEDIEIYIHKELILEKEIFIRDYSFSQFSNSSFKTIGINLPD